jgi:hypothetical protein
MHIMTKDAPAKLHAPGRPWHKTKVRLREKQASGQWSVLVRHWPRRARKANPAIGEEYIVTVVPEQIRLLPTLDRQVLASEGIK